MVFEKVFFMSDDVKVKNYVIPLRRSFINASAKNKTPRALRAVVSFIKRHTKADDVKIGKHLNEFVWKNGIENPPSKVKVAVKLEDGVAKAELEGFEYVDFVKQEKKSEESLKDKLVSKIGGSDKKHDEVSSASADSSSKSSSKDSEDDSSVKAVDKKSAVNIENNSVASQEESSN